MAHGNKSSPVFSVGSAISSLPCRLPSRVCSSGSLGLLAQPVCLGQSLLLLLSKIPAPAVGILQLPAPPPFLRALGGSRGNTKQEHRERELMSSGMLIPEAGECTCMCVSVVLTLLAQCPGCQHGDPAHVQRPWEEALDSTEINTSTEGLLHHKNLCG